MDLVVAVSVDSVICSVNSAVGVSVDVSVYPFVAISVDSEDSKPHVSF